MNRGIFVLALLTSACGNDVESGCPTPLAPEAESERIDLVVPTGVVTGEIEVMGTIDRPAGLTVFRVFVAGVPADNKDGDYSRFSAKLPLTTLVQMLGKITVDVETNCSVQPIFKRTFSVQLPLSPLVPSLTIEPMGPMPTTLPSSLPVTVTSQLSAVGATVTLTTTLGSFDGGTSMTSRVFVNDGTRAAAFASLIGIPPGAGMLPAGTATVIATSGGRDDHKEVELWAPPLLSPAASIVSPPRSFPLDLHNRGRTSTCRATPATGITFTFDNMSIGDAEHTSGATVIDVEVTGVVPPGTSAAVTCRDALGQTATATIVIPAPP